MIRQISQVPRQVKVTSTPKIKLKHNDISDDEFKLLMNSQRVLNDEVFIYFSNFILLFKIF